MEQQNITDIREYRIKRRRAGSARWILILVLLVVSMFAGYFFARSDFFNVTEITVNGTHSVDAQRVMDLSGFKQGVNIFSVTVADAEQWILIEPCVKKAEVKRRFPGRVEITVQERDPAALMSAGKAVIELDIEGKVLRRYQVIGNVELPFISGVDLADNGAVPGSVIESAGITEAMAVLKEIGADDQIIGEVNVANTQDIRLYTRHGVEIRIGDCNNFAEKYLLLSVILTDLSEQDEKAIKYVDVSIPSDPTFTYR